MMWFHAYLGFSIHWLSSNAHVLHSVCKSNTDDTYEVEINNTTARKKNDIWKIDNEFLSSINVDNGQMYAFFYYNIWQQQVTKFQIWLLNHTNKENVPWYTTIFYIQLLS